MATQTITPASNFVLTVDAEVNDAGELVADLTPGSGGGLLAANNLSDVASAATSRTNLGGTATGVALFTAANAAAAATAVGATATGAALLTAANAAAAATAVGATATGAAVLTAASGAAAQTSIGITAVGQTVTTAASIASAANAIGANMMRMGAQIVTLVGATAEVKHLPWAIGGGGGAARAGFITNLVVVLDGTIDVDATITPTIDGAPTVPASLTLVAAGSAAGTRFAIQITGGNAIAATGVVALTVGGGNTNAVGAAAAVEGFWT